LFTSCFFARFCALNEAGYSSIFKHSKFTVNQSISLLRNTTVLHHRSNFHKMIITGQADRGTKQWGSSARKCGMVPFGWRWKSVKICFNVVVF